MFIVRCQACLLLWIEFENVCGPFLISTCSLGLPGCLVGSKYDRNLITRDMYASTCHTRFANEPMGLVFCAISKTWDVVDSYLLMHSLFGGMYFVNDS